MEMEGSKKRRLASRFVITKDRSLSNDDKKRATVVVAECRTGRSGTLRTAYREIACGVWNRCGACPCKFRRRNRKLHSAHGRDAPVRMVRETSSLTLPSTSEGWASPSAVGWGSSLVSPDKREDRVFVRVTRDPVFLTVGFELSGPDVLVFEVIEKRD